MSKYQKKGNSQNNLKNKEEEENSKNLLNRKIKRDNNNINSSLDKNAFNIYLPNEIRCSICLEYEKYSSKCYKCIICSSYFHLECYNLYINFNEDKSEENRIDKNNLNNFICQRCKEDEKSKCSLCNEHDGIIKKTIDNKYEHYYCHLFKKNISATTICKLCKKRNKLTIKCCEIKCNFKCHIKCGIEKGLIFSIPFLKNEFNKKTFFQSIIFMCEKHNTIFINSYLEKINNKENDIQINQNNSEIIPFINDIDYNIINISNDNKENKGNKSYNSENYEPINDIEETSNRMSPNNFCLEKGNSNENNSNKNINENKNNIIINKNIEKNNDTIKKDEKKENLNNNIKINKYINNEHDSDEEIDIKKNIDEKNKKKIILKKLIIKKYLKRMKRI